MNFSDKPKRRTLVMPKNATSVFLQGLHAIVKEFRETRIVARDGAAEVGEGRMAAGFMQDANRLERVRFAIEQALKE